MITSTLLALALTRTKIALLCLAGGLVAMALWFGRRHPRQMALAGCSLVVALVLAEVGLRLFYPQISQHNAMFQPDPVLGWRFIPSQSGSIVYAGEVHHFISTNASGFRGQDPSALPPNGRRVLVMGDSFVSNISVAEQEVFTAVMQQRLGDTTVVNLGVNGYGVVQEYLLLQQWCDRVKPDLVVLMIYTRNDFEDNVNKDPWLYPRPYAAWEGGAMAIHPPPALAAGARRAVERPSLLRRSHAFVLLNDRLNMAIHRISLMRGAVPLPSGETPPELYLNRLQPSDKTAEMYRTMEEMLLRVKAYTDDRKVPLVVVVAPSMYQVDDDLWASLLRTYRMAPDEYSRSIPNDRLMRFAQAHGIAMLDLLPPLQVESGKGTALYFPLEQHWTATGNRVVAEALVRFLQDRRLMGPGA
jgi:hypothetical protein